VRFWDTSALIPLILFEPGTARVIRWLRRDPDVTVWTLTRVELLSALARRRRAEPPSAPRIVQAKRDILEFWARWFEITAVEPVRQLAERVVESHQIRAADAIQIAAALVAADERPGGLEFVTLDVRQAMAAEREGLHVLGPG
jgi:predicted nucleic acid-binding protein